MKIKIYAIAFILGYLAIAVSCNKRNDYHTSVDVVREWNFNLSSTNQNFAVEGPETNAAFHMVVLADNSIRYDVKVDSVSDKIVAVQIRMGDPVTDNGTMFLSLPVRVYSTYASGIVTGLDAATVATLLNNNVDKYVNVTTIKAPNGLVRGQLNVDVVMSKSVALTGGAVVPAVTTPTTGRAFLRLGNNNMLYSKVLITNDDPADPINAASINQGISTANGQVVVNLASSPSEFGSGKKTTVNNAQYTTLLSNNTYVTASSAANPNGKIRGQVR